MNRYQELGPVALGSTLRQMADQVTNDATTTYQYFGFDIDPKWFPVFYVLANGEADSVVDIAAIIEHSHVSVSKIVKEMKTNGLIRSQKSKTDSRVTRIQLRAKAKKMIPAMERQCEAVRRAIEQLTQDTGIDLYQALKVSVQHLKYSSVSTRIKQFDHQPDIRIIDYAPKHQVDFRQLNIDWISRHWELEAPDYQALDDPDSYILDRGGAVLIALHQSSVVGCCALIKMDGDTYELAKMAVSPNMQGNGLGTRLGQATIERARAMGARRIYLESNAVLEPAVKLYRKLGFTQVEGVSSPYQRCDVQMELFLDESSVDKQL